MYPSRIVRRVPIPLLICVCLWIVLAIPRAWAATTHPPDPVFKPLMDHLRGRGFADAQIRDWFGSNQVRFEGKILGRMLSIRESKLDYAQFLRAEVVEQCRRFIRTRHEELRTMHRESGVEPEVVVAILMVESRLGAYQGDWSTFGVLASQAVLDSDLGRRRLANFWPTKRRAELNGTKQRKRLAKRSGWARDEVTALARLADKQGVSALSYTGSVFGALGMCQFMPSSILRWGRDGDGNGQLEMHQPTDAIHSVGNYLKAHGWRPRLSAAQREKVVLTYNHSRPYAQTVLDLARRIRGG